MSIFMMLLFLSFQGFSQTKEYDHSKKAKLKTATHVEVQKNTQTTASQSQSSIVSLKQEMNQLKGTFQIKSPENSRVVFTPEMVEFIKQERKTNQSVWVSWTEDVKLYILSSDVINKKDFNGLPLRSN